MKFKTLLISMVLATTSVSADITLLVPQKPGAGTSQWAGIVATEFAKTPALNGEDVVLSYNPGARDQAGFNKFHLSERFKDNTIMVSHGGNGVSYVLENVKYDYTQYDSVCHQNLNIIVAKRNGVDEGNGFSFAAGSGMVPEALAIVQMIGGPGLSVDDYVKVFNEKVTWVPGLSGGQRRLAFQRGELLGTRENPAAHKSKTQPTIDKGEASVWFHHGVLNIASGVTEDDVNFEGKLFKDVFKAKWGVYPEGDLFDAYTLIKTWRDSIQKALWVNKGNPNLAKFRQACTEMSLDPESIKVFEKKIGKYDWVIGEDGNKTVDILHSLITLDALYSLIKFNTEALGLKSVYKPTLVNEEEAIVETSAWWKFW